MAVQVDHGDGVEIVLKLWPARFTDAVVHADNLIFANTHGLLLKKSGDYNDTGLRGVWVLSYLCAVYNGRFAPFSVQELLCTQQTLAAVAQWLQEVVIGLNLCPFARKPFMANKVRIEVVAEARADALIQQLQAELRFLDEHPELDTSILVLTQALDDFLAYNDFVHEVEDWLWQAGYEGIYQVASFHPDYYFADTEPSDVSNFTNRALSFIAYFARAAAGGIISALPGCRYHS